MKDCYDQYIKATVHFNNFIRSALVNTFIWDQLVTPSSKVAIFGVDNVPLWQAELMEFVDSMKMKPLSSSWLRWRKGLEKESMNPFTQSQVYYGYRIVQEAKAVKRYVNNS